MEAEKDFIPCQDMDRGAAPAGQSGVGAALAALRGAGSTAAADAALRGFRAASDFAGAVEELARCVEYLQLVAADAVDRTRKQPSAGGTTAGTSWTTGWRVDSGDGPGNGSGAAPAGAATGAATVAATVAAAPVAAADDGYRNTAEFLRARLRISAAEARRRLSLAGTLLPRQGFSGQQLPPRYAELGAVVAAGEVGSRPATIIALALDRVRHLCDTATAQQMEHALARTAAENDPDFLARVARSWTDAIDQDGAEPSEELLRQLQGAFIRKPRHGLRHLEIFATTEQFEYLLTVMNTGTNPRTSPPKTPAPATGTGSAAMEAAGAAALNATAPWSGNDPWPGSNSWSGSDGSVPEIDLDRRSRPQKLLDGLVGGCKAALTTGNLPVAGGLRPQVIATIDYRDLLSRLGTDGTNTINGKAAGGGTANDPLAQTGMLLFTGPVTAATVRKIACDADIIPVLLGSEGRILDIGRATRVFPPHLRKALTARDQGCAFPGCTTPAPWCEAHHITYWSRGGTTGIDNGTLLCSHHHHLIHKEQWTIQIRTGVPWFIPPPHLDPRQKPRRNRFFHPTTHYTAPHPPGLPPEAAGSPPDAAGPDSMAQYGAASCELSR
ncbi:MAG: DUF222 domain-containing protein [Arthrobacter sp.]